MDYLFCASCGTLLPGYANYCFRCGVPVFREPAVINSGQPPHPSKSFILSEDELGRRLKDLRGDEGKESPAEPPDNFACCYSPSPNWF